MIEAYTIGNTKSYDDALVNYPIRRIEPRNMFWGSNEYHPAPQWILQAWDGEKQGPRSFAMKDIHSWTPVKD